MGKSQVYINLCMNNAKYMIVPDALRAYPNKAENLALVKSKIHLQITNVIIWKILNE